MLNLEEIERIASEEWQSTQPPSLCRLLVRNEIPALIRELRTRREQLLRYGRHAANCEGGENCVCGFDAIKRELEQEASRE